MELARIPYPAAAIFRKKGKPEFEVFSSLSAPNGRRGNSHPRK
jgi:hypothetical protein